MTDLTTIPERAPSVDAVWRRLARFAGTGLIVAGVLGLAWVLTVWLWQDPLTSIYTRIEQHKLASSYDREARRFDASAPAIVVRPKRTISVGEERRIVAAEARRYRAATHEGQAIARIRVPRMGLDMVVVDGTETQSLKKGPGRDLKTYMPGQGQLVYIAGHRTTYLAPFSHIDSMRVGDRVTLQLPYATFVYAVTGHVIVPDTDLSRLVSHGRELLALQACHPRFFATHRYIVYAKVVRVIPAHGPAYSL